MLVLPHLRQHKEAAMEHHFHSAETVVGARRQFNLTNFGRPETLVNLAAGEGWTVLGKRRQQTLYCLQGSVWVTQECDLCDYVLEAGDAFIITLPGRVVVHALQAARIGYAERLMTVPFKGPFHQTVFN
jgi:quercetin dioxygenase-like cupin family protein